MPGAGGCICIWRPRRAKVARWAVTASAGVRGGRGGERRPPAGRRERQAGGQGCPGGGQALRPLLRITVNGPLNQAEVCNLDIITVGRTGKRMRFSLLLLLTTATTAYRVGDIKHFLVLFAENRAFDHIFGCAKKELPGIDGIPEGAGNWLDPDDHSKGFVNVTCGTAQYVCHRDEDHSFPSTTTAIFGPGKTNGSHAPYPVATMSGCAHPAEVSNPNRGRACLFWWCTILRSCLSLHERLRW